MRVLVVDDEPAIRQLLSRALTGHGFRVDTAPDGAAGLDMVERSTYDVVVLDVVMPGTPGTEVLPQVLERSPGQNVVMLSALGDPRVKVRCLELGAVDYVTKPFTLAELVARLRVHGRRGTPPAAEPVWVERRRDERRKGELRRPGEAVTREELLQAVWGPLDGGSANVVDVYVGRLRAKLGADAIQTIRR